MTGGLNQATIVLFQTAGQISCTTDVTTMIAFAYQNIHRVTHSRRRPDSNRRIKVLQTSPLTTWVRRLIFYCEAGFARLRRVADLSLNHLARLGEPGKRDDDFFYDPAPPITTRPAGRAPETILPQPYLLQAYVRIINFFCRKYV